MNMRQLFVQKFKLITVLGGREWARHPVEPFRTDIKGCSCVNHKEVNYYASTAQFNSNEL